MGWYLLAGVSIPNSGYTLLTNYMVNGNSNGLSTNKHHWGGPILLGDAGVELWCFFVSLCVVHMSYAASLLWMDFWSCLTFLMCPILLRFLLECTQPIFVAKIAYPRVNYHRCDRCGHWPIYEWISLSYSKVDLPHLCKRLPQGTTLFATNAYKML